MNLPPLTWLYTPPTRATMITRAYDFLPDAVIYDLEDAVKPEDKNSARQNLLTALQPDTLPRERPHLQVRINGYTSQWFEEDIKLINELETIDSLRIPKVETAEEISEIAAKLSRPIPLYPLIETAKGVQNLEEICASPQVACVALGEADLRAELRSNAPELIDHIRIRLVLAAAAAGITSPMGSAWLNTQDNEGLGTDTEHLAGLGFFGRTAIHPTQLNTIRLAFKPSADEYHSAQEILSAIANNSDQENTGALLLSDGTFIDRPVALRAQHIVALWNHIKEIEDDL